MNFKVLLYQWLVDKNYQPKVVDNSCCDYAAGSVRFYFYDNSHTGIACWGCYRSRKSRDYFEEDFNKPEYFNLLGEFIDNHYFCEEHSE